jgi:dTDP-4-amino-4,6-dideoxygalactose transaminase
MFHVLVRDRPTRDALITAMRSRGIGVGFHFIPLHSSEGAQRFGAGSFECPVSDDIAGRLIRLPFHAGLTEADIERVVTTLTAELRTLGKEL